MKVTSRRSRESPGRVSVGTGKDSTTEESKEGDKKMGSGRI